MVTTKIAVQIPDRDFRVDMFRGLALWLIFIDHSPENQLSNFTLKNLGFSDAAEIFVFLSGLASGFVYGAIAAQAGFYAASWRALRRVMQLYLAQIILFWLYLVEVWLLAGWRSMFLHDANIAVFLAQPIRGFVEVLALRYSPVNLDVLILMVILHLALPVLLPGVMRFPRLTLTVSGILYAGAHLFGWTVPAYPVGTLYFNPFSWQLPFVIGVWWGATQPQLPTERWLPILTITASIVATSSFVFMITWKAAKIDLIAAAVGYPLLPVNKGNLDLVRLIHFFSLAFLCYRLIPSNATVGSWRLARPLVLCGENPLMIYCAGVLLAFAAHAVFTLFSSNLLTQIAVTAAGIAGMSLTAWFLSKLGHV